jgi:hypothetical protein
LVIHALSLGESLSCTAILVQTKAGLYRVSMKYRVDV